MRTCISGFTVAGSVFIYPPPGHHVTHVMTGGVNDSCDLSDSHVLLISISPEDTNLEVPISQAELRKPFGLKDPQARPVASA